MSEEEPGLFISDACPLGYAYIMDLPAMTFDHGGQGGTKRGIAVHPDVWAKLTPVQQEEVRDSMVRHSVEDGFEALNRFLERKARSSAVSREGVGLGGEED